MPGPMFNIWEYGLPWNFKPSQASSFTDLLYSMGCFQFMGLGHGPDYQLLHRNESHLRRKTQLMGRTKTHVLSYGAGVE